MRHKHGTILLATAALFMTAAISWAADILVTGDINGTRTYYSSEGIVFDYAILKPDADVTAISTDDVTLKPGTRIEAGASLLVRMKDTAPGSFTNVGGLISTDTTWTLAGSPYIVTSNITVQGTDGADGITTLTIEPGVVVKFNQYCIMDIGATSGDSGALIAAGTACEPLYP